MLCFIPPREINVSERDIYMKTAVLVVSFGTSHGDTLDKTITAIEKQIEKDLHMPVRRAFTSNIIMQKWAKQGVHIDSTGEALNKLYKEGYCTVIVQPTHIINGDEYEKMLLQLTPYIDKINILVGKPLLTDIQDYKIIAEALSRRIDRLKEDEGLVLMGHGTGHYSNSTYPQMEYVFRDMGMKDAFIGTVEGYPGIDEVIRRLREKPELKRIRLMPFMIVAGDHVKNDMAGNEDSWKTQLEDLGYTVTCIMQGLGENEGVRKLYSEHAVRAQNVSSVIIRREA